MARHLTYFVSDVHLGLDYGDPAQREAVFLKFLRGIPVQETESLYLLGDIWDFWYEYKDVIPKVAVRVIGALCDLMEAGVKVYFFQGNHDCWTYSYFQELGIIQLQQPFLTELDGKRFCMGHGDGLGPGDKGYKAMRWLFDWRPAQIMFSTLHPRIGFYLMKRWLMHSRKKKSVSYQFRGSNERLYIYCDQYMKRTPVDYFIFGHYHSRTDMPIDSARLLILGDWVTAPNWICYDSEKHDYSWIGK